ncbi:hypothetical protein ACSBR1_012522 [Camellia fascicularis]
MAAFLSFDLVVHYEGKVGRVYNIDPDMYCHVNLLKDVHESVLSNIGLIEALAIHLYCDIPGTDKRRMLENDINMLDRFYMQNVSKTINLYVDVVHSIGFENGEVNDSWEDAVEIDHSVEDGNGNVDEDDEYQMDDFVSFSNEDKDWNENVDPENESDSISSEYVLSEDDGLGEDDGALSDYQSGDDVMVYDPCLNPQGKVVLEKRKIFADVNSFRVAFKDYIGELAPRLWMSLDDSFISSSRWVNLQDKNPVPQHTCSGLNQNIERTADWIAKKLSDSFKENPNMGLDRMQGKLNKMYVIDASKMQL